MPRFILNILPVLTHFILTTVYGVVVFLQPAFSSEETDRTDRLGNIEVWWQPVIVLRFISSYWPSEPALSHWTTTWSGHGDWMEQGLLEREAGRDNGRSCNT